MRSRIVWTTAAMLVAMTAAPALAECLGPTCDTFLITGLLTLFFYIGLGLTLVVMLVRRQWRRAGVKLLIASVMVLVGVPLVSQGWAAWKLRDMASHEIAGTLPDLQAKTLLVIAGRDYVCDHALCKLAIYSRGTQGAYGLPVSALTGLDTTKPLALADLPLELWQAPLDGTALAAPRPLNSEERKLAAERIDYVMVLAEPRYVDPPNGAEVGLRHRKDLAGLADRVRVNLALGPVKDGTLDLAGMKLDLLDLRLDIGTLALPLAPGNWQGPGNATAGLGALRAKLCNEAAIPRSPVCATR